MKTKPKAQAFIVRFKSCDGTAIEPLEYVGYEYDLHARVDKMMRADDEIKEAEVYLAGFKEPTVVFGYRNEG